MTTSLIDQLTALAPQARPAAQLPPKPAEYMGIKPGSATDRIMTLMEDGKVWSSRQLQTSLNLERGAVNYALRYLARIGKIELVGTLPTTSKPGKLYRKKASTRNQPVERGGRAVTAPILATMDDGDAWHSVELAEHLGIERTLISVTLQRLEKIGRIRRVSSPRTRPVLFKRVMQNA